MDRWETYRMRHLSRLKLALEKGEVDPPIVPLLRLLNSHPHIVTTSSCSGRIVLLSTSLHEKKKDSYFHRKWHRPVHVEEVLEGVESFKGDFLWFKLDPFIVHVAAKTLELGYEIVKTARSAGVKVAGIQSIKPWMVHVEMRNIENMALPVVWEGEKIAEQDYLRKVVSVANMKIVKNQERLETLHRALKKVFNRLGAKS